MSHKEENVRESTPLNLWGDKGLKRQIPMPTQLASTLPPSEGSGFPCWLAMVLPFCWLDLGDPRVRRCLGIGALKSWHVWSGLREAFICCPLILQNNKMKSVRGLKDKYQNIKTTNGYRSLIDSGRASLPTVVCSFEAKLKYLFDLVLNR